MLRVRRGTLLSEGTDKDKVHQGMYRQTQAQDKRVANPISREKRQLEIFMVNEMENTSCLAAPPFSNTHKHTHTKDTHLAAAFSLELKAWDPEEGCGTLTRFSINPVEFYKARPV